MVNQSFYTEPATMNEKMDGLEAQLRYWKESYYNLLKELSTETQNYEHDDPPIDREKWLSEPE